MRKLSLTATTIAEHFRFRVLVGVERLAEWLEVSDDSIARLAGALLLGIHRLRDALLNSPPNDCQYPFKLFSEQSDRIV
jgi:hypothetical protein